jgi:peptidyl-tRNA hydrolase, PTH1 family
MKYLIAGLGNIGPEYELTRHNIGFLVLDRMADNEKVEFKTERLADRAEVKFKGRALHLIKPNTYMNLSGKAIAYWMQELKIPKENLLVIVDEIALPFGSVRVKPSGSAGGHNGLKNIETLLATQEYPRVRVGIGSNYSKGQQVDYVLSRFSEQEFEELPPIMDNVIKLIESFATIGMERTMNFFNKKGSK